MQLSRRGNGGRQGNSGGGASGGEGVAGPKFFIYCSFILPCVGSFAVCHEHFTDTCMPYARCRVLHYSIPVVLGRGSSSGCRGRSPGRQQGRGLRRAPRPVANPGPDLRFSSQRWRHYCLPWFPFVVAMGRDQQPTPLLDLDRLVGLRGRDMA